jgi:hypothetical protein
MDQARAKRLAESGIAASNRYLEALKESKRKMEEEIQDTMDISAATDVNAGRKALTSDEISRIVEKYHALSLKLELKNKEIEVAEKIHKELSSNE